MRLATWVAVIMIAGCGGVDSTAPAVPQKLVPPDTVSAPATRVVLAASSSMPIAGTTMDVTARVIDGTQRPVGNPQVRWRSHPESAVRFEARFADSSAYTRITLLEPGRVEIVATVDGRVGSMTLLVAPIPSASPALVVERFALFLVEGGVDDGYVMPLVTLREPTGRHAVELIGVSASVPMAPPLAECVTSRVWAPGMTADAFGMSYGSPEFGFGPYARSDFPIGPVELLLVVRKADGALETIRLSRTMTMDDVVTAIPTQEWRTGLACP
ncbi:MAG: hypothetical protein U5K74_11610 [Gemmatimonadaceae bacterium]|nr:hypothetical protein [Gemmatimonadaceae bacterium]